MGDNVSKFYNAFSQKYDNFGTEQEFRDFLKGAKRENIDNLYNAFSAKYDNFNSADDMVSYLGWSDSSGKPQPVDNSKWGVTPSPYWNPEEKQAEQPAPQQPAAPAEPAPSPAPAPKQQAPQQETPAPVAEEPEVTPFPYSGGLEQEAEDLKAQLANLQVDEAFVEEYATRKKALEEQTKALKNLKGDIRNTGIDLEKYKAESAWLKENAGRYQEQAANKARIDEINGRLSELQKPELRKKAEEAREARNEKMRGQSENNSIRYGSGGFASYPKDMSMTDVGNYFAADQLDAMTDQELDKGSKFDAGYKDNPIGTAITQFVAGGINNVDLGSLTAGLSEGGTFKDVRNIAEKNNGLIDNAFKSLGYDDAAAGKVISDAEEAWEKLQPVYEQLDPMVAELKEMEATLDALAKSGDADKYRAAYDKYKKKYDEYAKLVDESKPLQDAVDKYRELMEAVQDATTNGLSESERDVLDSFARYVEAKGLSAATESTASKAGAGAEQSLEFMLDFIITRGLGKAGTKAASKIAANSLLKKKLGETGAKIVGRGLADMGTSAIRTSLMFPRNLAAYGEQITSMDRKESGVDEFGRYTFDRSKANAALNTALSQYIEYWSEGFGEYFGAAEQSLFRNATKLAPKTAIGQTLKNYRGSIGKYLDYGKFDGMFNEMLEEVVGSTFNALNGWVSSKIDPNGPGVGDKEALKEFVAGDNLATLFFSFLPMSAIGAATNMKAYHQMKERYDKSVGILNPFIEDGSINREDLEDLTSRTAELSPEQIMDKFKEISRKAAEAQEKKGKVLPKNFDQALAGYLEGSFSMNLQREAWEDSKKIFAVASAYTAQYENPDARSAWDLAQEEQAARAAALAAGFTEEDLDKDSAILARESAELEETEPERSNILYNYSIAKGQSNGLKDGYDNQTRGVNERNAQFVRSNIDTNGQVVQATLNGNTPVYITQADATVNPDGTVSTPTGDGVVEYVDQAGNKGTAKASAFSGVVSTATGEYIESKSADYAAKRQAAFETMQNTVSPTGQARALNERVGQSVIVTDHNGVYQPFKVERLTNGGSSVVLSGDKKALQGVAEAMGIRVPTSGYLEAPVTSLYPLLAKEEDGSLSTGVGETSQQEAAPAAEQAAGLGDLRDQTVPISVNGQVQNAHVIDMSDGSVMYEEMDENGDVVRTSRLSETDFARAMQEAANPTPAAETPAAETPAAAVEETPAPEAAAPVIPVDEKTGEKMYAAPGVRVEDAIADLYATEGLTEADVDQYIAEEAAKAEAARNPERGNMSPQAWGQAKQEAARVADFWAAMQRAAEQRKAQQEAAIEEAVEEATPVETTEAQPAPESKQRIAPAATPMTVDSRRRVVARLKNWARRTGVKVNIIRSVDEVKDETARKALKEGRALTGWFNDKTGQVDIFLPNVMNAVEADKTFIHETVAHKGLRGLLGEEGYNALCDRVWNELMTPEEQEEFMEYNRHLQGSEEYLHRAAADEYIARLSENMDMQDNRNIFEKIVDWIMDLLRIGGNVSGIEEGAAEKATAEGSLTRSDLYDLLEDSLKRFEKGRKKLNTESLPAEIQNEMQAKGLVMDGGAVMDEQQGELKKATGYQTPNELDMESSPEVGNVRFSESTMPAWARNYMTYRDAKKHVVQVLENFVRDVAADELVHGMVPTGVYKYGEKSSGSFSGPLRTNIEYIVTFDMDTSCPRSLQYLEYVKQIEAKIGRPLTQVESIQLIEMMRMYGQMIPCVYCYCENKRQALKQYYTDFMRARTGVINAKTEEEALAAMYGHNTTAEAQESTDPAVVLTPAAYEVFKKWRQEKDYNPTIEQLWYQYKNDRNVILTVLDDMLDNGSVSTDMTDKKITNALCKALGITGTEAKGAVGDIVSEWKWDRIEDRPHNDFTRIEDEDDLVLDNRTLTLWREMTSYGKSASGAKNVLRYVPYTDELKDLSQEQRDFINGLGGLRMHSSNDFRIDYVLDYFQFMADMAVNHMFGHTYTKSPEFVRIFGGSGYKINMSIAAYEDSRGIRPNPDEGFDWATARELRERFPNAGVMLMATSDAQIQFALDNDWVDMCIPFHHSGLPKAIWKDMRAWSDYTSTQNEKFLNATEMREALKADGVAVPNKLTAEAVEKMYIDHFNIKVLRGKDGKRMRPHFLPGPTPKDGVTIPGHNNDYETYMRLCREYGVHPRFYGIKVKDNTPEGGGREVDITEHPGYMKFIKETARTDTPQTAIEFNFDQPSEALGGMSPIEYALSELRARAQAESEAAGGPVRNIYESYKEDPYGIVPQFIDGVLKHKQELGVAELPLDYLTPDSRKWFMTERKALESAYKDFDTIPYHPHEYDENGNLIMTDAEGQPETDAEMVAEEEVANTMFREVTDPATVEWFNSAPKTTGFRTVVKKAEDTYGSPMAGNLGQVKGKKKAATSSFMRNVIEQAEENPDIADENGKVKLIKPKREDGKKLTDVGSVDYNPYIHLRLDKINRQFKDAWKRDDLIYIESEVPVEEVPDFRGEKTPDYSKSPYHAEKAALPVGIHDWNGGALMLSRYDRPFREVPWEEVADAWAADEDFQKNGVHFDIVPPQMRDLLTERGIEIIPPHKGMGQDCFDAYNEWKGEKNGPDGGGTRFREADTTAKEEARQSERTEELSNNWTANAGLRLAKRNIENGVQLSRENPGFTFRLGRPGGALLAAGVLDQPIHMSEYDLVEASGSGYGDKHSYHPFDIDDLKDLTSLINHPIAVFRDKKNPYNRVLLLDKKGFLTDRKETGKHDYVAVIASVPALDENGNRIYRNKILTIFPAENRWRTFYNQIRDVARGSARVGQDVMWVDNKKLSSWVKGHATAVSAYDTITQKDIANIQKSFENKQDLLREEAKNLRSSGNTLFRERITPEQDKEYMDAVNAGDMEKASQMVRDAAKAAGYNSPKLYHGSDAFGFTSIRTDAGDDGISFWATNKEKVAGSYTKLAITRKPGTEINDADYDRAVSEAYDALDDEIRRFRYLIDKHFSEWYFGQQGNEGIRKVIMDANHEPGYGDGVYDVLEDYVAEAYDGYGEGFEDEYEDFADWEENSPEAQEIFDAINSLEGLRNQIWQLENGELSGGIYELYSNTDNMFVVDAKGKFWNELHPEGLPKIVRGQYKDVPYRTRDVVKWAKENGYDGVIFKNIRDNGRYGRTEPSDVFAFLNPQTQVKSADTVTYDDNGNVIPLSERFNPENNDIRFREASPVDARNAQAGYEEEINRKVTNFLLEWQDQDIPVRIAINQVMNEVGMENLPEDCDYLTRHNLVSSRADAQMHNYKLFFFEPMMQTIGQIEDILAGGKPSFFDRLTGRRQKRLDAYRKIVDYCYAVSALERNAWKRAEAQRLMEKALERLSEKWEQERAAINADSRLTDEEKAKAIERAEKRYQKESREIEDKYADRDYSGITALMGHSKEEWQEAEDDARAMIADFQRSVNNNDLINEMWDRIRACTDFNLEHAYKFGLLSRAEYERLHGTESQPRMWEYYIPLRGFAEDTAEDLYNYTMFTSDMAGGDVVKKAKGRVTEADDPFATMRHISEQEIVQGLQNWAKQALYNFVLRAGSNSLLTQVEPWYVKEPGSDNWTVAEPNEGETLEEFEARMQEAYEDGDARRGRNGLKLGRLMGNKMHRNQHMIRLKLNGAEKMIWVNGNPILAQAINGISGWNNKILNGVRTVNRALSQFYTTYSLKFLTKNKLRDTQFSRIAALVDEPQAYLRQLEKNWWANNGIAFGYPMMKLVSAWESGELEKKENRTEREQMFIDFMYDGGATGYTMINSMDKIKRELERMVKNAGRGERNIPIIDWYAKGVGALNEASELLTRFTFYQTSRMMGRSRERSAYDAKESSVNFNRRGLRSGIGVSGWTSAAASALYLFINPAIQGLDKFVRLHKSHPWRMGLVDATYFMMGFVNSLLNAMIAGASDGDGDDDEKMGPDWYWNIPEWVRRSNMIIGSPFKKLGKWGYLVLALPIEYKGFYAMGELASALVQGKYAAKDAPTIANEVVGVVAELLPVNPVEGYTPGDNPAMSVVRNLMPDIAAPLMDVATNRSFAGIPLWKENIYDEAQPLSQSAFASTPEILNKAVIKLSEVTSDMPWHVDIPSGAVRGLLKGYGGGAYTFVEDMSKLIFADEAHPRRWDNVPFVSGFTGYLEEDRRDSFNSNALQRYKELSDDVVKRVRSAAPGEDLKAADIYNHPESLPQNARVTILLNSDRYILGQMYYNGMLKAGDDVKKLRSNWNKAKKAYLEIADDKNVSDEAKDAAEKEVQRTWLEYTMAEDGLVDRLMEEEYNHARQKIANGIPYEPKETLGEKAYNLTNRK